MVILFLFSLVILCDEAFLFIYFLVCFVSIWRLFSLLLYGPRGLSFSTSRAYFMSFDFFFHLYTPWFSGIKLHIALLGFDVLYINLTWCSWCFSRKSLTSFWGGYTWVTKYWHKLDVWWKKECGDVEVGGFGGSAWDRIRCGACERAIYLSRKKRQWDIEGHPPSILWWSQLTMTSSKQLSRLCCGNPSVERRLF